MFDNGKKVVFLRLLIIIFEKMNFRGTIFIKKEEEWFEATCIENNIASQGKTIDEATANIKKLLSIY